MSFKDGYAPSTGPKVLLCLGMFLGILFPAVQMFGSETILSLVPGLESLEGNLFRQILIVSLSLLYLIRFGIGIFVFTQRRIRWFEGSLIAFLWFMMFFLFGASAGGHPEALGWNDGIGIGLFAIGSTINSLADYQRRVFKRRAENAGRLYTKGLFKYATHINYFGDGVMYVGLALVTLEWVCLLVSFAIIANFVVLQIPMQDKHLREKYGAEFLEYAGRTKKFIPFVY